MMKARLVTVAAAAAALLALPAFAEDLTIVYKVTGGSSPGTATTYYSASKMRNSGPEFDSIVEYGAGRIISIDHKKKEYSEITLAEMQAAMARMEQAAAKMNEQMAGMPPAMREKMEQMMGGAAGAVTVTKGAVRKVAGYDCQDYTIAMGTSTTFHVCATTALTLPPASADFRKYGSLAMGAAVNSPLFKSLAKITDEMMKIQGVPLAESSSMKMLGKSIESSKEATEVKKGPIPASAFDVAAVAPGYKKVPHPLTKMK